MRRASQTYRRPRSSRSAVSFIQKADVVAPYPYAALRCSQRGRPTPPLPERPARVETGPRSRCTTLRSAATVSRKQPTSGTHQRQTAPRCTHGDGSGGATGEVGVAATTRNADPVARQAANTDEPAAAVDTALRGSPLFCAPEVGWPRCTLGSNDAVGGVSTGSPEVLSDLDHRVARC